MRLLNRRSDDDEGAPVEGARTEETERVVERRPPDTGEETPRRPFRERFRRTTTVPVTVPTRSVRRTVTIPSRRVVDPSTAGPAWDLSSIAAVVLGGALAVVGIVVLIRTGLDETWFSPEVEVLDADHTALLGGIEIGAGALLMLLGLAGSRILVAMAGIASALVATAAAVEPEELARELAIESWWAWVLAGAGVVLTLLALQEPRTRPRPGTVIDVR